MNNFESGVSQVNLVCEKASLVFLLVNCYRHEVRIKMVWVGLTPLSKHKFFYQFLIVLCFNVKVLQLNYYVRRVMSDSEGSISRAFWFFRVRTTNTTC